MYHAGGSRRLLPRWLGARYPLFASAHRVDHCAPLRWQWAPSGPPSQDYAKACGSTGPLQMFLFYIESPSTALQHLPARAHTGQ